MDPLLWIMSFDITDGPDCLTLSIAVLCSFPGARLRVLAYRAVPR